MAKIGTYPVDGTISGSDKLIGTDAADGSTKNFTVEGLGAFINQNFPVPTLQQVLDEGNTATSDITLTGDVNATNGNFSNDMSVGGDLSVVGAFDVNGAITAETINCNDIISDGSGSFTGGVAASSFTTDGEINASSAIIIGNISAVDGTFSGNVSAVGGTFTGNVSAVGGTFTGPVELSDDLEVTGAITVNAGFTVNGGAVNINVPATMSAIDAGATEVDSLISNAQIEASTYLSAATDLIIGGGISLSNDYGTAGQVIKSSGGVEPTATWENINFDLDLLIDSSESANQISGTAGPNTILFGGPQSTTDVSLASNGLITFATAGQYLIMTDFIFGNVSGGGDARLAVAMYKSPDTVDNQIISFVENNKYHNVQMVFPFTAAASNVIQFKISKDTAHSISGGLYGISTSTFPVLSDLNPYPSARIRIYKMVVS